LKERAIKDGMLGNREARLKVLGVLGVSSYLIRQLERGDNFGFSGIHIDLG
jgi:hypothetical protein